MTGKALKPNQDGNQVYMPVSFVARDWNVSPRRIRTLLTEGRLAGRVQDNGYWEVQYPYSCTLGTRGPGLRYQQKSRSSTRKVTLTVVDNQGENREHS